MSVSQSVHRGRGCLADTPQADTPGQTPPWADNPWDRHPPWADTPCPVHAGTHPPAQCMLGYTPPVCQTVRILLECILVFYCARPGPCPCPCPGPVPVPFSVYEPLHRHYYLFVAELICPENFITIDLPNNQYYTSMVCIKPVGSKLNYSSAEHDCAKMRGTLLTLNIFSPQEAERIVDTLLNSGMLARSQRK